MQLTRRRFAKYVIVGGAATGAAAVAVGLSPSLRALVRHAFVDSRMGSGVTGPISRSALDTLNSFTTTLLDDGIDWAHYEAMFNLRASAIPGHRELIESFAGALDDGAMNLQGTSFSQMPVTARLRTISDLTALKTSELRRLEALLVHPTWILFNRHIVRPLLIQYARSDAWLQLGYDTYPGHPRGLDFYTTHPGSTPHE